MAGVLSKVLGGQLKLTQAHPTGSGAGGTPSPQGTPILACNHWGYEEPRLALRAWQTAVPVSPPHAVLGQRVSNLAL